MRPGHLRHCSGARVALPHAPEALRRLSSRLLLLVMEGRRLPPWSPPAPASPHTTTATTLPPLRLFHQTFHVIYNTYDTYSSLEGQILLNSTMVGGFLCGAFGALYQMYQEHLLYKKEPGKYPPGPIETLQVMRRRHADGESWGALTRELCGARVAIGRPALRPRDPRARLHLPACWPARR